MNTSLKHRTSLECGPRQTETELNLDEIQVVLCCRCLGLQTLIFDYLIADQPSHHFQSLMTYSETTFQKAFKNRYKKIPKRRNSNIKLLHNIYLKKK